MTSRKDAAPHARDAGPGGRWSKECLAIDDVGAMSAVQNASARVRHKTLHCFTSTHRRGHGVARACAR
jgi:hypothetical protein